MDMPGKDGTTRRAHLKQLEKTSGETPQALLDEPEMPYPAQHIWHWWWELHEARSSGGMGPGPITYRDIQAWAALTNQEPTPQEVKALRMMDRVYMGWVGEKRKKENPKSQSS